MNKYPLIRLWSSMVAPFVDDNHTPAGSKRVEPKQSKEAAQQAIMQAKLKRARKKAKRANVLHGTTQGD